VNIRQEIEAEYAKHKAAVLEILERRKPEIEKQMMGLKVRDDCNAIIVDSVVINVGNLTYGLSGKCVRLVDGNPFKKEVRCTMFYSAAVNRYNIPFLKKMNGLDKNFQFENLMALV